MAYKPVGIDESGNLPTRARKAMAGAAEMKAAYVQFVDENGNPLPAKRVLIKVNSTTGEIIDIVAEG